MAVIEIYDAVTLVPARYDTLFEAAEKKSVFLSRAWFETLAATTIGSEEGVRVFTARSESGEPLAVLPMVCPKTNASALSARTLRGLSNHYASLFEVVSDTAGDTSGPVSGIANAIRAEGRWDVVDLHPLDEDGNRFSQMLESFKRAGFWVSAYFCFANWYLKVDGRSFDEYQAQLPAALRNTIRRREKQLRSQHGVRLAVTVGRDGLDAAIQAFEAVYAASWKGVESHPAFIRELIRLLATNGWLRLGVLYVENEPAAAQLWMVVHRRASIYKLAHDERFDEWSVGSQLTLELMRHVLDIDKVEEVDYLTGDEPYKKNWMSHRRVRSGIVAFDPRRVKGVLAALRHFGGRWVRRVRTDA